MELEGNSKKKLPIPETSSEKPVEHSEIANNKNSFSCYSDVHTKNKNNPNQKQNEKLDPTLNSCESILNLKFFVRKSKIQPFK